MGVFRSRFWRPPRRRAVFVAAGAIIVSVGQATETDTAQPVSSAKIQAVGLASETDTGLALSARKTVSVGLSIETSTAFGVSSAKTQAVGLANEADTAFAVTVGKLVLAGLATEADTAFGVGSLLSMAVGLASEADSAFGVTALKTVLVGQATEADSAFPVSSSAPISVGLSSETDSAFAVGVAKALAVGQALETDSALPVFTAPPPGQRIATALEHLFLGEAGARILIHDAQHLDDGAVVPFTCRLRPTAPAGVGGECLFRSIFVTLESLVAGSFTVTPIVDGKTYDAGTFTVDGLNPERKRFEIPVMQDYDPGGGVVSKAGVPGTWIEVEITGSNTGGPSWDLMIEAVTVDYDVVRESLPHRAFEASDLTQVARTLLEALFIGEAGDSLWTMDVGLGAGVSTCPENSTDGLICKDVDGLETALDYRVGADLFHVSTGPTDAGWVIIQGPTPVQDLVGGYVELEADLVMYYFDPAVPEAAEMFVTAEVWYEDCADHLPGTLALLKSGDADNYYFVMQTWIIVCTDRRMTIGRRFLGSNNGIIPVVAGPAATWYWNSQLIAPGGGSPNTQYGSDNDTNWDVTRRTDADLFGRVGHAGIRCWALGSFSGRTKARLRQFKRMTSARIVIRNIPDAHQAVIERDSSSEHGAGGPIIIQNTSGGVATITFDSEGWPTPGVTKLLPAITRIYVTTIGDPSTKLAEMLPSKGVNWGDGYCYDCSSEFTAAPQVTYLLHPNDVAPMGPGGECLFSRIVFVITRNNDVPIVCNFTPIVDDVTLPVETLTLAAVTAPVTEVHEIVLKEDYDAGAGVVSTYGVRGTWFRLQLDGAFEDTGKRLIFEGAALDWEPLRESLDAILTTPA